GHAGGRPGRQRPQRLGRGRHRAGVRLPRPVHHPARPEGRAGMTVFVAVVAGFLAARLLWLLLRPTLSEPAFLRDNYRGHSLPTAGGLLLLLGYVLVEAGRAVAGATGSGDAGESGARLAVGVAVLGFGLLGLMDDLAGRGDARGFRGHAAAL